MKFPYLPLLAMTSLATGAALAADSTPPVSSAASQPSKYDSDLRVLLRDLGTGMHKHFVFDPRLPQTVDLGGLDPREVTYPQLLSVLAINGLALINDGGISEVLLNTDIRQAATPLVSPDNIKSLDDEWITCVVPVKNLSAAQLVPLLRPMLPSYAHLAPSADRNALLIVDRSSNVRRLIEIIRTLEALPKVAEPALAKP